MAYPNGAHALAKRALVLGVAHECRPYILFLKPTKSGRLRPEWSAPADVQFAEKRAYPLFKMNNLRSCRILLPGSLRTLRFLCGSTCVWRASAAPGSLSDNDDAKRDMEARQNGICIRHSARWRHCLRVRIHYCLGRGAHFWCSFPK
jgi:hypothetical protein